MSSIPFVVLSIALAALYIIFKRSNLASLENACAYLRKGALLIDVRSPTEYKSGHLPKAINLPLNELDSRLPALARNKKQVLLLHCKSGMRSSLATKRLKRQGYVNTFNLGSYSRASRLVRSNGS